MKKVNTVVAKAIIAQLAYDLKAERESKTESIKSNVEKSADYKKYLKLREQIDALRAQKEALESKIEKNPPKGFCVDVRYGGDVSVSANKVVYNEEIVLSDIILMAHDGKTVQQIKTAIRNKYFKQ